MPENTSDLNELIQQISNIANDSLFSSYPGVKAEGEELRKLANDLSRVAFKQRTSSYQEAKQDLEQATQDAQKAIKEIKDVTATVAALTALANAATKVIATFAH